jgi:hypothetical protein
MKGGRLPSLAKIAATAEFSQVTVTRYGRTETVGAAVLTCLQYSVFGSRPVIIVARFKPSRPDQPTSAELSILRLAWEDAAPLAA